MSEAQWPTDRRYHRAEAWASLDGDVATFGVTAHALAALGEVVDYAPPELGSTLRAGDGYGEIESIKAVADVIAPVGGAVLEVNESVVGSPEQLSADPYGCWLVRVRVTDPQEFDGLLEAAAAQALGAS